MSVPALNVLRSEWVMIKFLISCRPDSLNHTFRNYFLLSCDYTFNSRILCFKEYSKVILVIPRNPGHVTAKKKWTKLSAFHHCAWQSVLRCLCWYGVWFFTKHCEMCYDQPSRLWALLKVQCCPILCWENRENRRSVVSYSKCTCIAHTEYSQKYRETKPLHLKELKRHA